MLTNAINKKPYAMVLCHYRALSCAAQLTLSLLMKYEHYDNLACLPPPPDVDLSSFAALRTLEIQLGLESWGKKFNRIFSILATNSDSPIQIILDKLM